MEQILVVDDQHDITHVLADSWLPALGYRAWTAHTYAAAQTTLAHNPVDLVLLDRNLPDTHGVEHVAALRQQYPDVPLILLTEHGSEEFAVDAFRLGIRNSLIKPFTFDQLQHALQDALRERRLQRENDQLTRSLRQRIHELVVLSAIGRSVTRALRLDEVLTRIVEAAIYLTEAEEGFLLLRDGDQLVVRAARTADDARTVVLNQAIFDHTASRVMRERQPVRLEQGSHLRIKPNYWVQSALLVPLLAGVNTLGVLGVDNIARAAPFTDEQERLLLALGDYAAIAIENARLFAAKQRSEARYHDLFRNASDLLLVVDRQWRVVEANAVAPRLLDRTEDELVGQPLDYLVAPTHWPHVQSRLQHVLRHERPLAAFEVELLKGDGRRVLVELGARVFHDDNGQPLLVCALRDLTERQLQTQIAHAEKLAAIERVVAGMAHELNNPLASIAGYSQLLLRDDSLNDEVREDIEHVLQQSRRAGQMVQNLLTIGQDLQLSYSSLDMSTLVASTLGLPLAQPPANIAVRRDLSWMLPPVLGDPYQLQQVLVHLLNNAIRAMHPNGGTLRLCTYVRDAAQITTPQPSSPLPTDPNGTLVVVEVSDTGSGIAAHQLSHIFDPFWTTKNIGDGPGLGLSMSRGIVARHGGHMWVHSVEEQGTTVFLALPVAPQPSTNNVLPQPPANDVVASAGENLHHAAKHIPSS
jgi:two-component system NtrC family sensor kinase